MPALAKQHEKQSKQQQTATMASIRNAREQSKHTQLYFTVHMQHSHTTQTTNSTPAVLSPMLSKKK